MRGWWGLRRGSAGRSLPTCGHGSTKFRIGKLWGTPPLFCEEWAKCLDAVGYGRHVFESVQGVEGIGVAGVRESDGWGESWTPDYLKGMVPQL